MAARGAAGGFVITSGSFTEDAKVFVNGLNVKLLDGPKLYGLIQQARAARAASSTAPRATVPPISPQANNAPACPVCKSRMVRRTAKKGANAGAQFWGCSQYPSCRGTR
jgi:restriction system protein